MKKTIKVSGFECGFKAVASRKKRKRDVLAEGIDNRRVAAKAPGAHSWGFETGDTTKFESIDIEEECLVEETSVDYGKSGVFTKGDPNQMPKGLRVKTKKVLGKPLGVIDYGGFYSSKFAGIIRATFTSEKAMMAAGKLANDHGVVVNTNLKHPVNNHINQAIMMKEIPVGTSMETMRTAVSEFGLIKSIKMQLMGLWQKAISIFIRKDTECVTKVDVNKQTWNFKNEFRALLYTLSVETNAHNLWEFVDSVGGKTCVIDCNPISYAHACCATVCFGFESDLVSAMAATPVIKGISLCWSHLSLALCLVCGLPGHTSLNCVLVKVRLANIYTWKSMPISHPLVFSGKTWASVVSAPPVHSFHSAGSILGFNKVGKPLLPVASDLEKCLVNIESSLISLMGQIGELAKRLDSLMSALPVTLPLQNQGEDIVIGVSLGDATGDKTAAVLNSTASSKIVKLKNMLESLSALVMSLSAHLDGLALTGGAPSLPLPQ
ncbi:hypothetical protein G9A89_023299 [Geosiphon pyriformis]|nr:hypothetical protein G9A89_023299 [Geosiphon pyriformis]